MVGHIREDLSQFWKDARNAVNDHLLRQEEVMLERLEWLECALKDESPPASTHPGTRGSAASCGQLPTGRWSNGFSGGMCSTDKPMNSIRLDKPMNSIRLADEYKDMELAEAVESRPMAASGRSANSSVTTGSAIVGYQLTDVARPAPGGGAFRGRSIAKANAVYQNVRNFGTLHFPAQDQESAMARCTRHWAFNFALTMVIGLNAVTIGVQANEAIGDSFAALTGRPSRSLPLTVPDWVNVLFLIFFVIECMCRAYAERSDFIFGPQRCWNTFDLFLVISGLVEVIAKTTSLSYARTLRLLRMVHVLQVIRMMRVFDVLRHMAYAILNSMFSMVWVMLVLLLMVYVYGVFLISIVAQHVQSMVEESGSATARELQLDELFGTISRSMLTIFEGFTGGRNYHEILEALWSIHWVHSLIYVMFFIFIVFGVLNIITGIFVERATELAQLDKEMTIMRQMDERKGLVEELRACFRQVDGQENGVISLEQFCSQLKDAKVKAHFQTLGIDVHSARTVFQMLDRKRTGVLTIRDFIEGCMRLRGAAKSTDMIMLRQDVRRLGDMLGTLVRRAEHEPSTVPTTLGSGQAPFAGSSKWHAELDRRPCQSTASEVPQGTPVYI